MRAMHIQRHFSQCLTKIKGFNKLVCRGIEHLTNDTINTLAGFLAVLTRHVEHAAYLVGIEQRTQYHADTHTQSQIVREYRDNHRRQHDDAAAGRIDRKSTRLNSSHVKISYAVFCLK